MAITRKAQSIEDSKSNLKYEEYIEFALKVKLHCEIHGDYRPYDSFGKVMVSYNKGFVDYHQMYQKGQEILANYPDLLKDFNTHMASFETPENASSERTQEDRFGHKDSIFRDPSREKRPRLGKNSEKKETCDASNLETCTPSYLLLPPSNDKGGVLNSLCAISTKEVDSRLAERSELEEAVDRLEDQRFKSDLLRHNVSSALENLKKLESLVMEKRNSLGNKNIKVRDHLSHSNLMCLRLVFKDEAKRIIEFIGSKPKDILPYVIQVLEDKKK